MHNSIRELTTCLPLLRTHSSQNLLYWYRRLTNDTADSGTVIIVVGKEKRVFHADRHVLDTYPFKCLMKLAKMNGNLKEICGSECKGMVFLDLDVILVEHMLWLISEKISSTCDHNLMLDMREIVDFHSQ
jgi:hypothetical protein